MQGLDARSEWLINMGLTPAWMKTPAYLTDPNNWGPPMIPYSEHIKRLGLYEILSVYMELDKTSPSGLCWRRDLTGTRGASSRIRPGDAACVSAPVRKDGSVYLVGRVANQLVYAHRVVFFLANGYLPEVVDHRDRNTLNNLPSNLRASTHVQNARNLGRAIAGFYWNKAAGKFYVRVSKRLVCTSDDMLTARAEYIRAYVHKHGELPNYLPE